MFKSDDQSLVEEKFWNSSNVSAFSFDDAQGAELKHLREMVNECKLDSSTPYSNENDFIDDDEEAYHDAKSLNFDSKSVKYSNANSPRPAAASTSLHNHERVLSSPGLSDTHLNTKTHNRAGSNASSTGGLSFLADEGPKSVDYARLESEYNKLKLKFEHMKRDKYRPADVKDTVRRLMNCDPCTLEAYKSKKDKLSLLSAALDLADGSVITTILLYLRQTFSYALFQEQLLHNTIAANHYVTYLRDHFKYDELITTLFSIGRKEEAALIEYNQAVKKRDALTKIQKIKKSIQSTFSIDATLNNECQTAVEYCDLLERQLPIEVADAKIVAENKDNACKIFKQFPKVATLIDQPLLTTLYYCCLYHYELPITSSSSPLSMKAHYQLTDKQYCWVAVKALSRRKCWLEIEKLLTSKNLFGASRLKSPLGYDKLLQVLSQQGATPEILSIYVRQVTDNDRKLELAEKFHCHMVVVDCLVALKDRQAIVNYRAKLTNRSTEARYAESAMLNSNFKWKN